MKIARRLTDTPMKKAILLLGAAAAIMNAVLSLKMGLPAWITIGLFLINALFLWLTLHMITCLRDGKCHVFSSALAVWTIIGGVLHVLLEGVLIGIMR